VDRTVSAAASMVRLALPIWRSTAPPESRHEQQPIVADGLIVVADARIDNRAELAKLLRSRLRDGASSSDSNVILAAFKHWGSDCASRLIGDFAFVIWAPGKRASAPRW
jgi:asparagine synthase (glutamine-hydrolysing)